MGTGQGGGRSGGGGREARERSTAGDNQHLEPDKQDIAHSEFVTVAEYEDLPPVANANRMIMPDGQVLVGSKGALPQPKTIPGAEAEALLKATGVPSKYLEDIARLGDDALSDVAGLTKGWTWQGGGVEGAVWAKGDKILRVQVDGLQPLNHYNIGKIGVYPDWTKQYKSGIWIEQKPRIWKTADDAKMKVTFEWGQTHQATTHLGDRIQKRLERNVQQVNPRITNFLDNHPGNWGWDSKGRTRIIDPGAALPSGAKMVAGDL